ncbi:MAG: hypothetical protein LUD00_05975 [Prevotellaceae bacterium]|nr:hypothetical protein [Prevotellaceae bacterium]
MYLAGVFDRLPMWNLYILADVFDRLLMCCVDDLWMYSTDSSVATRHLP